MPGMRQSALPRHLHTSCLGWQNRPAPGMPVLWGSRDHVGMCDRRGMISRAARVL